MIVSRLQRSKEQGRLWRKQFCLLVLLALVIVTASVSLSAQGAMPRGGVSTASPKDETVFAQLAHDGRAREVWVVNTFRAAAGPLLDYGAYSAVENLTDDRAITLEGGRVEVAAGATEQSVFRYQGKLAHTQLPWLFTIAYQLDGESVTAERLLGASGRLRLSIAVRPNPQAGHHFTDSYTLQATVPLFVDKSEDVYAPGATSLLVGNRQTLGFMVQPGESHEQTIEATVRDFALPSIEITAFRAGEVRGAWRDDLETAMSELSDGLADMVSGSTRLQGGLADLHAGVGELSASLTPLTDGTRRFEAALGEYATGVGEFAAGLSALLAADLELGRAGQSMVGPLTSLQGAYADVANGLRELRAHSVGVHELATTLRASPDPAVSELAQIVLLQLTTLEQLERGLEQANRGLGEFGAGHDALAQQQEAFSQGLGRAVASSTALAEGISEIAASGSELLGGVAALPAGVSALHTHTGELPRRVTQLVDGQRQMLSGVHAARRDLRSLLGEGREEVALSFADSARADARSVQFVFLTSPVTKVRHSVTLPQLPAPTTLAERIFYLVRRILAFGRESAL